MGYLGLWHIGWGTNVVAQCNLLLSCCDCLDNKNKVSSPSKSPANKKKVQATLSFSPTKGTAVRTLTTDAPGSSRSDGRGFKMKDSIHFFLKMTLKKVADLMNNSE